MADPTTRERDDFFAALARDHARIEETLQALEHAAHQLGAHESDPAARDVVARTLRFFALEGARHEAREELTLFPRLRALPEFKQILSALEFQHRMNLAATQELSACLANRTPGTGRELQRLSLRFVELHRGHAIAEERALFPLAAARLTPPVLAEMSRELSAREG